MGRIFPVTDRLSVIMTSYNGARWIKQQIDSILAELQPGDQLIIYDDCSTDETVAIIEAYNDPAIHLRKNTLRLGPWKNVAEALLVTNAGLVAIADQDDIWLEGKRKAILKGLSEAELIMHDAVVVDDNLGEIFSSYFQARVVRHGVLRNCARNSYSGCLMAFHQSLLQRALPIPSDVPFDQWLGVCAELSRTAQFVDTPYTLWRRHSDNVTTPFCNKRDQSLKNFCAHFIVDSARFVRVIWHLIHRYV